jgi:hypothetical protein
VFVRLSLATGISRQKAMNLLADYRKRVAALAAARTGEPISNGSVDHAAIIIEQMFKSAERQVSILSGSLNARVYGRDEIVDQAKFFLAQSNHRLRILLESDDVMLFRDHPLFERMRTNDNIEVGIVPAAMRDKYTYHFMVMDDDSYRYEPTKNAPTAVAAFGDRETTSNLSNIFTILWDTSTRVDLRSSAALTA